MSESGLEARLRAHFDAEADGPGMDRLLAALDAGDEDGLDPEARAILADYRRTEARWLDPETAGEAPPMIGAPNRARRAALAFVALAAAVALFVMWQRPPPSDPGLTPMGDGFTLHVTVVQGDVLRPVGQAPLAAGDRLGLAFSGPVGHLRVFAASADGVAALHPLAGASTAIAAGEDVPLPAGAVLTPGEDCEWIVGLFSSTPIPLDDAEAAVADARTVRDARGRCVLGPIELPGVQAQAVEIPR